MVMSGKQRPDSQVAGGLRRHIPELAIEWALDCPEQRWRSIEGTLVFADISGFTALAERLSHRGRIGGEELVETLSRVFATMLDIAHSRGGMLLKFGGDALLLFFDGDGHAMKAAVAAVEMRTALRQAAKMPTSVGPLKLSMSVGMHSGDVLFFLVGATHRELILLGPAANKVVETENAAEAGQILLSDAAAAMLPTAAVTTRTDGWPMLCWRRAPRLDHQPRQARDAPDGLVAKLFPGGLGQHLARVPEPEHRIACMAFIKFSGTDAMLDARGGSTVAEALDVTVAAVQRSLATEDVTLLAIDVDRDGGKFFLGSGVPYAHEDDEGRMLRALSRIAATSVPLPLQFGINRGHVFVAEVGSVMRAAYSAMGDTTNTAARIASKAPPGAIYAHPSVLDESLTLFQVTPAGPFQFKGKKAPMLVYAVGEETGTRGREGIEAFEFVGRREERAQLLDAIAELATGRGRVIRIVAEPGMGKSRLLHEMITAAVDATVVDMRAEPYGAASPYRLFRDPLCQALGISRGSPTEMAAALEQLAARATPELMPYLSLVGDVLHVDIEPTEVVEAIDPSFRSERRAAVLCELLGAAQPGALMLIVDDAHWADEASVELLAAIARACAERPWLLMVARREVAGGFDPADEETLRLGPLANADLRQLIVAVTEAAPLRPEETREILRRAGGNPLFAMEILRTVRDAGSLDAVPDSLEAAMETQVDKLDADARRLLRYATVLGQSFSLNVLGETLATEDLMADLSALERLTEYLEPDGDSRMRFRTGLLRDVVYGSLSYRVRKRLHLAAGEAIERTTADPVTAADALALHFARGDAPVKTLHYGRLAAERARASYANQDAAKFYEMAIDAARQVADVTPGDTIQLWTELGDVRELSGLFDAALEAYRRALKLVDDPIERAELMLKRARARERAGSFSAALRELTRAKHLLSSKDTKTNEMLAKLQSFTAMVLTGQDRPKKALRAAEEAIRIATAANEPVSLVGGLTLFEMLNMELHGPGDGSHLRQALVIAQEHGNLMHQASVQANLGILNYHAGRWDDAIECLNNARELDNRRGDVLNGAFGATTIGEILVSQYRLDEAEALLSETLRDMRALGSTEGIANVELQQIRLRLARGDYGAAAELAHRVAADFEALQQARHAGEARLFECDALRLAGRATEALSLVESATASEVGYLGARTSLTRGTLLTELQRFREAAAEIDFGLTVARKQNLLFEEAQLLMARCNLAIAIGHQPDPDDLAAYLSAFDRLGVRMTPNLSDEAVLPS